MAGNPTYNQFGMNQMNFQDSVPTSGYSQPILNSIASMAASVNPRAQNMMNNPMNASCQRPQQPTFVNPFPNQQSNHFMTSQQRTGFLKIISEACKEKFRNPHQFNYRIQLQQYLLSECKDPNLVPYLSNGFLTDFCSGASFELIQTITNLDTSKLREMVRQIPQRLANAQAVQPQLPVNQYSPDNITPQNFDVQGNFNQFQVPGSNNSRYSDARGAYNQPQRVNALYPPLPPQQQQQQQQRSYQSGNVPNFTQNVQNLSHNTQPPQQSNQSTSGQRWYSMPRETYEAGRVVQERSNSIPSPQGTVPLTHYSESGPRTSSSNSQIYQGSIPSQGVQRLPAQPPVPQISPRTEAQCNDTRLNNGGQGHPQIQPRPKSAETISSAHMRENFPSPVPYLQQEKIVETSLPQNCSNSAREQPPVDSKENIRKLRQLMENPDKNREEEQNTISASQVQQPVPGKRLSGTPTLPVEETHESNSTGPSDITDLFSMPVLSEDFIDPKEAAKELLSRKDGTKHLDDMNVLSPYTNDVVSDSVETWLSRSKQSTFLDRVGSKTSQGRQVTKPERSSVPSGNIERTICEEEVNPLHGIELPLQAEPQGVAEYDPPLPVIKHRKREDRISPNKKSPARESKSQNMKDSKSAREGELSENRKSLFSVMSDLVAESNSKGNSDSELKSLESSDSKNDERTPVHPKSRHKSAEVSSSSSTRPDKTFLSTAENHHDHENNKPDSGKSVEHSKTIVEQSCKDKIVSDWRRNHIEKESNSLKGHNRRKSCNDQEIPPLRLNRERRSLTWDGGKLNTVFTEIENTTNKPVPMNGKLVDFNGHIVLQIKIPDGKYLLMQELLETCFKDYDPKTVFKAKTSALGVNNITLTHSCRKDVIKYLDYLKIHFPSQLSVVSLSNAQRLFDYLEESKHTEKTSEAKDSCVNQKEPSLVSTDIKNRSASPDSTENACKKPIAEEEAMETSIGAELDDLQQNKVSSQSLDDLEDPNVSELSHISALEDNDDAASNVSDATDIYCEGKPLQPLSGDGSGEGSSQFRPPLGLDGGLALVVRENSSNTYLRYVIVRGNKCYVYKDLFSLFGKAQVVNLVVNNYMKVKTCTTEEAEFFNRNQPGMSRVDPVDDSLLHEKYVRKVFLFFGEIFPKKKRPIDVDLTNETPSLKRPREDEDCEPPSKKMRRPSGSMDCCDKNKDSGDQMNDDQMKTVLLLKSQHLEMAAEVALLKSQLKQAQESNSSLEKKYKLYADNLISVKAEFEDLQKKNTELEEGCRAQEESLAQMKDELKEKDKAIAKLTEERDHFKSFVERITDTYQEAD